MELGNNIFLSHQLLRMSQSSAGCFLVRSYGRGLLEVDDAVTVWVMTYFLRPPSCSIHGIILLRTKSSVTRVGYKSWLDPESGF